MTTLVGAVSGTCACSRRSDHEIQTPTLQTATLASRSSSLSACGPHALCVPGSRRSARLAQQPRVPSLRSCDPRTCTSGQAAPSLPGMGAKWRGAGSCEFFGPWIPPIRAKGRRDQKPILAGK
ncbi:hypothetical protein P7K49_012846 [Saguinus oedipus]|uniref:Uncharacterized protein n=1 Tax=Saguinus oedipus TaxID=9490 RepID=A0ABQ9VE77_SAGOE|nr:hypothetical protein P7K49_012846 [Saguinus oedipus]